MLKNAHDAYAALKLRPDAPERSNLQPKKQQHLVPPPPQRRPSADAASSPRKRPPPEEPLPKKKKKPKTKTKPTPVAPPPPPLPTPSVPVVPVAAPAPPPQSSSSESDDEFTEPFSVDRITNQAQFLAACKRHDEAQAEYSQLKGKINKEHRHYVEALAQVDADRMDDENEVRTSFYRKLRNFYIAHGGTAAQWRTVVRLCRQFNWTLGKVNTLWDEIERAYAEHRFALPANAKSN